MIPTIIDGKQVKVIGGTAFNDKGLTSIVMPSTVTIIESGFSIPNGDGSVYAQGAFSRNPIKEIILPNSIISFGSHAFYHMSNLETVILPSNLLKIPPQLFRVCL